MTITLAIIAWLLSGFAAAYVGHKWVEGAAYDTTRLAVLVMTLCGVFTMIGVTTYAVFHVIPYKRLLSKPFFRSKDK